jgi:hypothetical protein
VKTLLSIATLFILSTSAYAERVAPGNMKAYCQGEASAVYGTKPAYIKTEKLIKAKDGSYSVKGTADLGTQGKKPFQCNFDKNGEFKDVMSLVNEGAQ